MGGFLVEETILFFKACILGFVLGILFDAFRIFRMTVKCSNVFVFIQDIIYFALITFITFMFLLSYNDGKLRMFILVGELMGSVVYFFSLSIIILKSSKLIINTTKKILSIILRPFIKFFKFINSKINSLNSKIGIKTKKNKIFKKFSLKSMCKLVYNNHMFKKNNFTE